MFIPSLPPSRKTNTKTLSVSHPALVSSLIFDVSASTLTGIPPTYNGMEARGTDDFKKSLLFILT